MTIYTLTHMFTHTRVCLFMGEKCENVLYASNHKIEGGE